MCILLEFLKEMCTLLEHYNNNTTNKSYKQYNYNFRLHYHHCVCRCVSKNKPQSQPMAAI